MPSNIHILLVPGKCEIIGIDSQMVPKKDDTRPALAGTSILHWEATDNMVQSEHNRYDFVHPIIYIYIWLCYEFVALLPIPISKSARSWCSRTTRLEGSWIAVVVVHCGPPLSKMETWWPTVHCCQAAHEWPLKVRAHTIACYFVCSSNGHKLQHWHCFRRHTKMTVFQHFKQWSMFAYEAGSTIAFDPKRLSSELLKLRVLWSSTQGLNIRPCKLHTIYTGLTNFRNHVLYISAFQEVHLKNNLILDRVVFDVINWKVK